MANYTVNFSCGHSEQRQLFGEHAKRASYIDWAAREGTCTACRKAEKLTAVEAVESTDELPALSGSEKQVAWARQLRATRVQEVRDFAHLREDARPAINAWLIGKTESKWWIDNRESAVVTILRMAAAEIRAAQ